MCRHLAYWGPPLPLSWFALDAPDALVRQCTAAREMSWGDDNLDGWGFAWSNGAGQPHSYRTGVSMADDAGGQRMLRQVSSDRFIVHVRQKTPGSATAAHNNAPFADGDRFFTHNGYVSGFRDGVRDELIAKVSPRRAGGIRGDTDSEVLFALVLDRLDQGAPPCDAVRAIAEVAEVCGGRYNILLWAGSTIIATRWDNSLYVRDSDGVVVSSEPLDDGAWCAVPERSMTIVEAGCVRQEAW